MEGICPVGFRNNGGRRRLPLEHGRCVLSCFRAQAQCIELSQATPHDNVTTSLAAAAAAAARAAAGAALPLLPLLLLPLLATPLVVRAAAALPPHQGWLPGTRRCGGGPQAPAPGPSPSRVACVHGEGRRKCALQGGVSMERWRQVVGGSWRQRCRAS